MGGGMGGKPPYPRGTSEQAGMRWRVWPASHARMAWPWMRNAECWIMDLESWFMDQIGY